jgi:predicted nucleotidyltransferase
MEMSTSIQIIKDLKHHLQKNIGDNVHDIILFGSRASESNKVDSDYDILIVLKEKPDWKLKRKISDYCYDIDLKYGIITDTHILASSEINSLRGKQPVYQDAIQNGIYA